MIHDAPQELHNMLNKVYHELKNARVHSNNEGTPETKASVHARQGAVIPTPGEYPLPLPFEGLVLIVSEYLPPQPEPEKKEEDGEPKNHEEDNTKTTEEEGQSN